MRHLPTDERTCITIHELQHFLLTAAAGDSVVYTRGFDCALAKMIASLAWNSADAGLVCLTRQPSAPPPLDGVKGDRVFFYIATKTNKAVQRRDLVERVIADTQQMGWARKLPEEPTHAKPRKKNHPPK